MSFLQDLINQQQRPSKQIREARGGNVERALQKYLDGNKFYSFEGDRGERQFADIVKTLGYRSISDFFADNSGAYEALLEWIGSQHNAEWVDALSEGDDSDGDDDDDDDY